MVLLCLLDLKDFDVGGMPQATAKPSLGLRQVHAGDADNVSRRSLTSHRTASYHGNLAGNVTDGHLVGRLLDLDLLMGDELGLLDNQVEVALDLVLGALLTGAVVERHELLSVDRLVHLVAAGLTSIHSHTHARLHIGGASNNAGDVDQRADLISTDLAHLDEVLLHRTRRDDDGVVAIEFGRDLVLHDAILHTVRHALRDGVLPGLLLVEAALLHGDFGRRHILTLKLDRGWRHLLITHLSQQVNIAGSVNPYAVNDGCIPRGGKEGRKIRQLYFQHLELTVRRLLQ